MAKKAFGYPILGAQELENYLQQIGIAPWKELAPPVSLDEYMSGELSEAQRSELRFAPKNEVVFLENPITRNPFTGFRNLGKPWATTFAVVPFEDMLLVPIVAEYKHGIDCVTLVPPSGVMSKNDSSFADTAKREFEEETGFKLSTVTPLCNGILQGASGRQRTDGMYPFFGELEKPVVRGPSRLDENELLKIILMPISEWLKALRMGLAREDCAASVTLAALDHMGLLFRPPLF